MTEKQLIEKCNRLETDNGTIVRGDNGKWWTFGWNTPEFNTPMEAYQSLAKEKCVKCHKNRKAPDSEECESCSTYLKPSSDAKTTKVGGIRI